MSIHTLLNRGAAGEQADEAHAGRVEPTLSVESEQDALTRTDGLPTTDTTDERHAGETVEEYEHSAPYESTQEANPSTFAFNFIAVMKTLLMLLIIAALGIGGWWQYQEQAVDRTTLATLQSQVQTLERADADHHHTGEQRIARLDQQIQTAMANLGQQLTAFKAGLDRQDARLNAQADVIAALKTLVDTHGRTITSIEAKQKQVQRDQTHVNQQQLLQRERQRMPTSDTALQNEPLAKRHLGEVAIALPFEIIAVDSYDARPYAVLRFATSGRALWRTPEGARVKGWLFTRIDPLTRQVEMRATNGTAQTVTVR